MKYSKISSFAKGLIGYKSRLPKQQFKTLPLGYFIASLSKESW